MSQTTAREAAARLKLLMTKHGVQCSIELQSGRPWSGDPWYSHKYLLMNHHTAGPMSGKTPSLSVVKRGRSDLPGPLSNGYGGRDFVYRIITMGLANHPGVGGPLTLAGFTVPKDSARITAWGTEWEHNGTSPWPSDMREFMGRANAALCEFWRISTGRSCEHSTWTTRKIDRNTYTASSGQAEIRKFGGLIVTPTKPPVRPTRPLPIPAAKPKSLTVDGAWGPATWRATQWMLRVPQTGRENAATLKALQRYLSMAGSAVSGVFSNDTVRHIQKMVKTEQDGLLGPVTIRAWQRHINRIIAR